MRGGGPAPFSRANNACGGRPRRPCRTMAEISVEKNSAINFAKQGVLDAVNGLAQLLLGNAAPNWSATAWRARHQNPFAPAGGRSRSSGCRSRASRHLDCPKCPVDVRWMGVYTDGP